MHKEGLGQEGLGTLIRAAFLRAVQIMRQSISNPGMVHSPIAPYHQNNGLSSLPKKARESRRITHIPDITNPIVGYA
jgi:hypothetical protein